MSKMLYNSQTEILAASIKSPEEAAATLRARAHHLTVPLKILRSMTDNELSNQTVAEFSANGIGITFAEQQK